MSTKRKLIIADHIYTPEAYLGAHGVLFDEEIREIAPAEILQTRYPDVETIVLPPHSVLYPGFINPHVHLEYSANRTTLRYGEFSEWLDSVIAHRDTLMQCCDNAMMQKEIETMLHSGITTFGAISNFATELEVCESAPQRVVFFNELIGSNPATVDVLYNDFLERIDASTQSAPEAKIVPAVAIHAPYSVHPIVLQKAIGLAKLRKMPLSTHFLESPAELAWLTEGSGPFKPFFEKYFNVSKPVMTIEAFMHAFDHYPTLFVHATQANEAIYAHLTKQGHSIVHCPRSNRYLGCGRLPIERLDLPVLLATDGLSSNDSLSILDEMRAALMLHDEIEIKDLAQRLIRSATVEAAEALRLPIGKIEVGAKADLVAFTLPDLPQNNDEIALWTILHCKEAHSVFIEGKEVYRSQ